MAFPLVRACQWAERRLWPKPRQRSVNAGAIQGFLVDGCEGRPFGVALLVQVDGRRSLGACLQLLSPHAVFAHEPVARSLALSKQGVEQLDLPEATLRGFEPAFLEGVTESVRAARLGDVDDDSARHWRWGGPHHERHDFLLLLHAQNRDALEQEQARIEQALTTLNARCTFVLPTSELPGKREHFGFRGGIAQPLLDSDRNEQQRPGILKAGARHNTIAPGEVVLGYSNEFGDLPLSPQLRLALPGAWLLPPTSQAGVRDLGANGSYLVVRQLDQDVQRFWRALDARSASSSERELLAAKLIGRWRSGAPLVLAPHQDRPELATADDFDYASSDARGARCPFGAHIRRANPRDWWLAGWGPFATRMSNQHRILRRSRPYGAPLAESMEPADFLRATDDGQARGLFFMAFNADIRRQFELIQEAWFNGPHFGRLRGEVDPLVGRAALSGAFTIQGEPVSQRVHGLPSCVRLRGSGYYFFPSLPAVRCLASLALS